MQLVTFERRVEVDSFDVDSAGRRAPSHAVPFESLEFSRPGTRRLGALTPSRSHGGDVVDLNRALAVKLATDDAGAPEVEADSLLPSDMLAFLDRPASRDVALAAFDWVLRNLERYDGPDLEREGVVFARQSVRLRAPIERPGKILGVARNYAAHAAERGAGLPTEPVLFLKSSSAVIGDEDDIWIPAAASQVDYEGELAVVIGRPACNVSVDEALACVGGYTAANDVTARDFQATRGQHFIGKSCDTFAPMGPALITADQLPDPQALALRTRVDGEVRQSATTKEMLFPVAEIISFASRLMTLEAGDVILTGTPEGVGAAHDPPRWLRDGDVVDVEIERIGRLRNRVRVRR